MLTKWGLLGLLSSSSAIKRRKKIIQNFYKATKFHKISRNKPFCCFSSHNLLRPISFFSEFRAIFVLYTKYCRLKQRDAWPCGNICFAWFPSRPLFYGLIRNGEFFVFLTSKSTSISQWNDLNSNLTRRDYKIISIASICGVKFWFNVLLKFDGETLFPSSNEVLFWSSRHTF